MERLSYLYKFVYGARLSSSPYSTSYTYPASFEMLEILPSQGHIYYIEEVHEDRRVPGKLLLWYVILDHVGEKT